MKAQSTFYIAVFGSVLVLSTALRGYAEDAKAPNFLETTLENGFTSQPPPPIFGNMMPSSPSVNSSAEHSAYYGLFSNTAMQQDFDLRVELAPIIKSLYDQLLTDKPAEQMSPKPVSAYQWFYQQEIGVDPLITLPETTSTLTLTNLQLSDAGFYKLHSTFTGSLIVYDFFEIVVENAPIITTQPIEQYLVAGEEIVLSIEAAGGTPPFAYQWYRDTGAGFLQVGTGTELRLSNATAADQGMYKCIVVDSAAPVALIRESNVVPVKVLALTSRPPDSLTVLAGTDYDLAYSMDGGDVLSPGFPPNYTHTWEFRPYSGSQFSALAGGSTNIYTIQNASSSTPAPDGHQGTYRYTVSDGRRSIAHEVNVFVSANPVVVDAQPVSAGRYTGGGVTFTVSAHRAQTPLEPLGFAWRYRASLLDSWTSVIVGPGVQVVSADTSSELQLTNLDESRTGYYDCVISTLDATPISATSDAARLIVGTPLAIATQPVDGTFHSGDSHVPQLSVAVPGGVGALTFQWYQDSGAGPVAVGGNTPVLDLGPLAAEDAGSWTCTVQDEGTGDGSGLTPSVLISDSVSITVVPPVRSGAALSPVGGKHSNGSSITLSLDTANLDGLSPYSYQWLCDGIVIDGATGPNLTVSDARQADSGVYTCRITDAVGGANGTALSALADVRVAAPLSISYQPTNVELREGDYAIVEIIVEGGIFTLDSGVPYTFVWEKLSGFPKGILPENRSYLEIMSMSTADEGIYRCTVSNGTESVISAEIEIEIPVTGIPALEWPLVLLLAALLAVAGTVLVHRPQRSC